MKAWTFHTKRFVVRYKSGAAEVCRKLPYAEQRIGYAVGGYSWRNTVREAPDRATDTIINDHLTKVQ